MKITVIIRDGVVETVLGDGEMNNVTPDVEIVNQDKDYEDAKEIEKHITGLYNNKDMEEIPYHTYDGEDCEIDPDDIDEMFGE